MLGSRRAEPTIASVDIGDLAGRAAVGSVGLALEDPAHRRLEASCRVAANLAPGRAKAGATVQVGRFGFVPPVGARRPPGRPAGLGVAQEVDARSHYSPSFGGFMTIFPRSRTSPGFKTGIGMVRPAGADVVAHAGDQVVVVELRGIDLEERLPREHRIPRRHVSRRRSPLRSTRDLPWSRRSRARIWVPSSGRPFWSTMIPLAVAVGSSRTTTGPFGSYFSSATAPSLRFDVKKKTR